MKEIDSSGHLEGPSDSEAHPRSSGNAVGIFEDVPNRSIFHKLKYEHQVLFPDVLTRSEHLNDVGMV